MAVENTGSSSTSVLNEQLKTFRDELTSSDDTELFDDIHRLVMSLKAAVCQDTPTEKDIPSAIDRILLHLIEAKSTMTTLPKQFIYISLHLDIIKELYENIDKSCAWKKHVADILSVVSIVTNTPGAVLSYRFAGRREQDLQIWGLEYVKRLIEDIRQEYYRLCDLLEDGAGDNTLFDELNSVALDVAEFCVKNNAEIELCDMAMEIEQPELMKRCLNEENYKRVLLYVKTCLQFVCDDELEDLLHFLRDCYIQFREYVEALIISFRHNKPFGIMTVLAAISNDKKFPDVASKQLYIKQITHIMYSHRVSLDVIEATAFEILTEDADAVFSIVNEMRELVPSSTISEHFRIVAQQLDILEPKKPEEIFKERTAFYYPINSVQDHIRTVIANTVVSGFINGGFKKDCILTNSENDWFCKLKDASSLTAVACVGLLQLWDIDEGLLSMDRYLYSKDIFVKAGAYLGCGLLSSGNPDAGDVTLAILSTGLGSKTSKQEKMSSIIGLGLAMAGTCNITVLDILDNVFEKHSMNTVDMEIVSAYAIAVGMIALGSKNSRELNNLHNYLHQMKDHLIINEVISSYIIIGYCLLYFGTQSLDDAIASFSTFPESLRSYISVLLNIMAYAGSGNVSAIQDLLAICTPPPQTADEKTTEASAEIISTDGTSPSKSSSTTIQSNKQLPPLSLAKQTSKKTTRKPNDTTANNVEMEMTDKHYVQCTAAIGIAAIGINDESGICMCYRLYNDILQYGNKFLRRIVPVGLALLSPSNPQVLFIDTLSKLSHDNDQITSCNAILSLGLIGAGTNNAKIASLLRQLTMFFYKDPVNIFASRLSLGLLHAGKGMLSLSPVRDNKSLVSNVALASLLLFCLPCIDSRNRVLSTEYYLFFWVACALKPRYLITLDEDGNPINIPVRVGQVVDTVGQAGDPRTITGFQTHKTPVLLGYNERAEFATEEYISLTPILEGAVFVKKNPDYQA